MYRRPIVTLIGNGDQITLDGVGTEFTLKPGMTGTGLAPWESTYSQLPRGGSVLRHRRRTNRTIMIPIDIHHGNTLDAYARLEDSRRRLEHLCEDVVEIRLKTKDGTRSAYGRLKDGLEGDFTKAAVNNTRMVLALTFECEDPWFYGPWREQSRAIAKGTKPFLSALAPTHGKRNLAQNPSFETSLAGVRTGSGGTGVTLVRQPYPEYATSGTHSLWATGPATVTSNVTDICLQDTPSPVTAGQWVGFSVDVRPGLTLGTSLRMILWSFNGTAGVLFDVKPTYDTMPNYDFKRISFVAQMPANTTGVEPWLRVVGDGGAPPPNGWRVIADSVTLVAAATQAEAQALLNQGHFDGNMDGFAFEGKANASPSVEMVGGEKFFPIRLSESSVQGEYEVLIEGDDQVWPVWEIVPPGTDAKLENLDTGEALFLSGQIPDMVTVDTRPRVQDITSPSMPDGQWWDRAGRIVDGRLVEQDLFPLRQGKNRIRMTMVAATADSLINLRYQETYKAGH